MRKFCYIKASVYKFFIMDLLFVIILSVLNSCSESSGKSIAGGVSEETNTLSGVLLDNLGNPVSNLPVFAKHFKIDTIEIIDTTDIDGNFGISLTREGEYGVSAQNDSISFYEKINYIGESIKIKAHLTRGTNIKGSINLREDTSAFDVNVFILGTPWNVKTDKNGYFELKNVPNGVFPLLAKSPDPKRFDDALFVTQVNKSGSSFVGPIPMNSYDYFVKDSNLKEYKAVDLEVSNKNIQYVSDFTTENLQFPLSLEYGLRSWWSMDYLSNGKESLMYDVRGWTEEMLVSSGVKLVSGVDKNALQLNGANQYGVIENDRGLLDSAKAFVLEAWVNINSIESNDFSYQKNIVGKLGFGSKEDKDVFSLAIVNGVCGVKNPSFAFFIADGNGDTLSCANAVVATKSLEFNKWVYVTAVWNGISISLYLDGQLVSKKNVSVNQIKASSEPIFFGKESINLQLDDVRFLVKEISNSDVLYRYYLKGGAK